MTRVLLGATLFLIVLLFDPCSQRIFRVPLLRKGLNNQRMRIIQDVTMATLLGAAVELPKHIASRKNCDFGAKCARVYFSDTPFWELFDRKITTEKLVQIGVILRNSSSVHSVETVRSQWPITASSLHILNSSQSCSGHLCSFGQSDCCIKLIPNTPMAVRVLKSVNHAFESAQRYRIMAAKIISAFKKETQQDFIVAMHWRLDDDFIKSAHALSPQTYCAEFLRGMGLARNRTLPSDSTSNLHILVLGESSVSKVEKILRSCTPPQMKTFYTLHSKDTLLDKSEFNVLEEVNTDLKGQLDFELGGKATFFLGSPFSSFSVLIAFYRFGSPHYKPLMTLMANVDVKDHLGSLFSAVFPYSQVLADNPYKCSTTANAFAPFHRPLGSCIFEEKKRS